MTLTHTQGSPSKESQRGRGGGRAASSGTRQGAARAAGGGHTYPVPLYAHTHFLPSVRAALVLDHVHVEALPAPALLHVLRVTQHFGHSLLVGTVKTLQPGQNDTGTCGEPTLTRNIRRGCTGPGGRSGLLCVLSSLCELATTRLGEQLKTAQVPRPAARQQTQSPGSCSHLGGRPADRTSVSPSNSAFQINTRYTYFKKLESDLVGVLRQGKKQ